MRKLLFSAYVLVAVSACGDNSHPIDAAVSSDAMVSDSTVCDAAADALTDSVPTDASAVDAAIDATQTAFRVSSTAITNGMILQTHSCFGANISPPLTWSSSPPGTLGYAVVFSDVTNGLIHSAIWDISPLFVGLPESVEKVAEPSNPSGSKQPLAYDLFTRGYLGPCPGGGPSHTYRFTVYAVDEYPLSGVTLQTSRQLIKARAQEHALAEAKLEAIF